MRISDWSSDVCSSDLDQCLEERALTVHGIEAFGFLARQLLHFRSNDLEASLLETGIDLTDDVLGNGVGLDDGKSALQRHTGLLRKKRMDRKRVMAGTKPATRINPTRKHRKST